ncbi:general substrate transporter [Lophiotrema nucula]|uniref:General substrate transporter n=1 Tax=Lophiotrema nucula TaxID=690887 RepID=A0A6A5ZV33_9PLEO|nr:general substrate transporter [Lophiotrema nucula]
MDMVDRGEKAEVVRIPEVLSPSASSVDDNADIKHSSFFFGVQGKKLQHMISVAGALGFLLFGYDQGVLGGLNASENFLHQFNYPSSSLLGTINAIYEIGCFCGAITVFLVGERLGRKRCIYVGAFLQGVGAILQASSFGVPQMIVGRIVCGWGNGFNTATTPLWVSELVPAKSRGRHVAVEGNLIAFGIVIAYYFNIGMSYTSGPVQWRLVIAFQIVIIILQVLWTMLLPESPRWLSQKERHSEALHVISQLAGRNMTPEDAIVRGQKAAIDHAIALETADGPWRFSECFKSGSLKIRRRYILAIGLQAMQQLSGINVLVYYAPHTLTTDIGVSYITSLHIGAGLADTYWLFSFIGVFWLDRMGRRQPLIWTALVCALCFLMAGILQIDPTHTRASASIAFFFLYEASFAVGWLPIPWLYAPEIMPLRHRTHSAALATASDWIFNYMIVQITPVSISNIRWKTYLIFFIFNIVFAVVVWLFYPETSGRTLEEVDELFKGDNDRILVVDRRGKILPGFASMMHRSDPELEFPSGNDTKY